MSATTWTSDGHVVDWLCMHFEDVEFDMDEKDAQVAPNNIWWVISVPVKAFLRATYKHFRNIRGQETLPMEQNERLQFLCYHLKCSVGIKYTLNSMSSLSVVCLNGVLVSVLAPGRHFLVLEDTVVFLSENTSVDSSTDLGGFEEYSRKRVLETMGNLLLTTIVKVSLLPAE